MVVEVVLELEVHLQTLRLLEMLVFVFEKLWSPKNVNPVLEFWKLLISLPTHKLDSLTNLLVYNEC